MFDSSMLPKSQTNGTWLVQDLGLRQGKARQEYQKYLLTSNTKIVENIASYISAHLHGIAKELVSKFLTHKKGHKSKLDQFRPESIKNGPPVLNP